MNWCVASSQRYWSWRGSQPEGKVLSMPVLPRASPLSQKDLELLVTDFRAASSLLSATLRVKTSYWQQLPALLVGLAATNEGDARSIACKITSMMADAGDVLNPEHHDALTVSLLTPGAAFRPATHICSQGKNESLSLT